MGLFRLLARTTIGLLFVGHGTQKLFGWFGGHVFEDSGCAQHSSGARSAPVEPGVVGDELVERRQILV
jgi:putative oxidoreductase